jgi:hypothetical protein
MAAKSRPGGDQAKGTRPASTAYPAKNLAFFRLNLVAALTSLGPATAAFGQDKGSRAS